MASRRSVAPASILVARPAIRAHRAPIRASDDAYGCNGGSVCQPSARSSSIKPSTSGSATCQPHRASLETSIQALRLGAADYLVKPMSLKQLQGVLSRVTKPSALKAAAGDLNAVLESDGHFA